MFRAVLTLLLSLFTKGVHANEYVCRLSNSSMGKIFGTFRDSGLEKCLVKCPYNYDDRLKERTEDLQRRAWEVDRLLDPSKKPEEIAKKSTKEIFALLKKQKVSAEGHKDRCLAIERTTGQERSKTMECLNQNRTLNAKVQLLDNDWDRYKNARAASEVFNYFKQKGLSEDLACSIMTFNLQAEAAAILDQGDYTPAKRQALLQLMAKQAGEKEPAVKSAQDHPLCKAFESGLDIPFGLKNAIIDNCI